MLAPLSSPRPRLASAAGWLSLWLGLAAAGLCACLWFPLALTSPEGRDLYPLELLAAFMRVLVVGACATGMLALAIRRRASDLVGIGLALVALVAAPARDALTAVSDDKAEIGLLGLDWLVIDGLIMALVLMPLESAMPHRAPTRRKGSRTDLVYFVLNHLAVRWIGGIGLFGALAAELFHRDSPVAQLPLVVQLVLLLIATDLAQYGLHRAMHEIPWLWRIHAVHHSSEPTMAWAARIPRGRPSRRS